MEARKLIDTYLQKAKMIQIATVQGDQPWCCTVYFVADRDMNIYWISKPDTRHSKEIHHHKEIAAAIPVTFTDKTVIGLSLEGDASMVENSDEIQHGIRLYTDKFKRGETFYTEFLAGKNVHKLYKIQPRIFALFDPKHFPKEERVEYTV